MFLFTFNFEARSHMNLLLISSIPNMDSICQTVVCIYLPWSPMITLPEHMRSPPVFSGVRVTRSLGLYVCFVDRCLSFCAFFLLVIVLSVLLLYTNSDYPCGIFKLFFTTYKCTKTVRTQLSKYIRFYGRQF